MIDTTSQNKKAKSRLESKYIKKDINQRLKRLMYWHLFLFFKTIFGIETIKALATLCLLTAISTWRAWEWDGILTFELLFVV